MYKKLINTSQVLISTVLVFQLAGCGTLMYPERKGQKSGKIDSGVAILDGIGLLFFLVPGIIAFAVDFNNGTIYLPGTSRSSLDIQDLKEVKFSPADKNLQGIERIIKEETGANIKLDASNVDITKLRSTEDMMEQFAHIIVDTRNDRMVSSR